MLRSVSAWAAVSPGLPEDHDVGSLFVEHYLLVVGVHWLHCWLVRLKLFYRISYWGQGYFLALCGLSDPVAGRVHRGGRLSLKCAVARLFA